MAVAIAGFLGLWQPAPGSSSAAVKRAAHTAALSPVETIVVDPNAAVWSTGNVDLTAGDPYVLIASGTAEVRMGHTRYDALYCYTTGCGPTQTAAIRIGTPGVPAGLPIDAFRHPQHEQNCQPAACPGGLPYDSSHEYTVEPFYPPITGKLEVGTGNQFLQQSVPNYYTPSSRFTVTIYRGTSPPTECSVGGASDVPTASRQAARPTVSPQAARRAHGAALLEVHVVAVCPDVQFHKGGTPADAWLPTEKNTILKAGDEITCDPDGAVKLAFADNSTVVVRNTTQLKIGSFFTEGGVVRTEILLKMGEVAATVNKSEATKSDFRIKPPTATISVRGTIFTVFYDPGSATTLVSTSRGVVRVTPSNPKLHPVSVGVGREVEFSRTYESPLAPIGKAGARGGIDILRARDLVLAVVARHNRACLTTTPRANAYGIAPGPGGWLVTVKLLGRVHGNSIWQVKGTRVIAKNGLAKKLARGCR